MIGECVILINKERVSALENWEDAIVRGFMETNVSKGDIIKLKPFTSNAHSKICTDPVWNGGYEVSHIIRTTTMGWNGTVVIDLEYHLQRIF
jgi:hypothetical protein